MNLASDPTIERKIMRMAQRVRWNHPAIVARNIDQTRLVIEQPDQGDIMEGGFHFLVLGDRPSSATQPTASHRRETSSSQADCRFSAAHRGCGVSGRCSIAVHQQLHPALSGMAHPWRQLEEPQPAEAAVQPAFPAGARQPRLLRSSSDGSRPCWTHPAPAQTSALVSR